MSEEEAALVLGISRNDLDDLLDRGVLLAFRVADEIRVLRRDVERYVKGQTPRRALPAEGPATNPAEPSVSEEPSPPVPGSLAEVILRTVGKALYGAQARFLEDGWELDGRANVACPWCGVPLWVFGKPWTSSVGINYRFWAIVCSNCEVVCDLDYLDEQTQVLLRDWRRSAGQAIKKQAAPAGFVGSSPVIPQPLPTMSSTSRLGTQVGADPMIPVQRWCETAARMSDPVPTGAATGAIPKGSSRESPVVTKRSPGRLVNLYVELTALERAVYEGLSAQMASIHVEIGADREGIVRRGDNGAITPRCLASLDTRASSLERLESERARVISNASRKRGAINDVFNAVNLARSRTVVVHDSVLAAEQSVEGLRALWIDAALVRQDMPDSHYESIRRSFDEGCLPAVIVGGADEALELPLAELAILTTSGRSHEERQRTVDVSGHSGLSISILVRGTPDEVRGALDETLFSSRRVTHHQWREPGDVITALNGSGTYIPERPEDAAGFVEIHPPTVTSRRSDNWPFKNTD